jgi:uncharacterized protein (TIGR02246 family)
MRRLLFTAIVVASGLPLQAAETCVTLDNKAVAALFDDWNFALSSLDTSQVVQRYWPDAVLLPTVSNTPRTNAAMIGDYFEHFLAKRPRGRIDTRTVQSGCNLAMDMGTYTFSLMDDKGTTSEVAARYSFVYQYRAGAWKILHHHSSAMPETQSASAPNAHVADEAAEKPAVHDQKPAAVKATPRKERRKEVAKRTETAAPQPEKAAAAAPAVAKAAPEAKPATAAKPSAETKPVALAKPGELAQPAVDPNSATEVKTAMFANLTASPSPAKFYPPESARRKERGNVNLKVCADGAGAVGDKMEILKSSGSKLLDEAAMNWARSATWVPATLNRRRVEGCTQVDVAFEPVPMTVAQAAH